MAFASSKFQTLPARPPTPPREPQPSPPDVEETLNDTLEYLGSSDVDKLLSSVSKPSATSTPQHTPPSSAGALQPVSTSKKRVDFAPFTSWDYHKTPECSKENASAIALKQLPPSRERSSIKSKSILKPSKEITSERSSSHSAHNFKSLAEMVEWALKALASKRRDQRLDAYVALLSTLQAYERLPDVDSLKAKIKLLLEYIHRDMVSVDQSKDVADLQLITRSMKVLIYLLRQPELKDAFDSEESAAIVDLSISVLQDPAVSKQIAHHHLEFLSQQKFRHSIITADRVQRILATLRTLEERVPGNNVVGRRVMIYQRLVHQIPSVMAARVPEWLDHVFNAMLSGIRDIKERAIEVGITSALHLGGRREASKGLLELLGRSVEEKTYLHYLVERLNTTLDEKEYAMYVPAIWSVPILYMRALRPSSWDQYSLKLMLSLIQRCWNNGDSKLKSAAFRAWNRLIYAENPDSTTSSMIQRVLKNPIETHFQLQKDGDFSRSVSRVALSSYCTLLYISLRPNTSFDELDLYWKEYVFQIWVTLANKSLRHSELGCRVLTALFESNAVWKENRPNEEPWTMEFKELPRLDPRWVRSRLGQILELVILFLRDTGLQPAADVDSAKAPLSGPTPPIVAANPSSMWSALIEAVAVAGNQEITASMELKTAIAHITNFFTRLWSSYSCSSASATHIIPSFRRVVETAFDKLGPGIFTEKILTKNSQDSFEVAPTPSHRSRATGPIQSPALHLIGLLSGSLLRNARNHPNAISLRTSEILPSSTFMDGDPGNEALLGLIDSLSLRCWSSKMSRNAQLVWLADRAEHAAHLLSSESIDEKDLPRPSPDPLFEQTLVLTSQTILKSNVSSGQTGQDYRLLLRILTLSLQHSRDLFPLIEKVYRETVHLARQETGDGGALLAVTEPHAEMFCNYLDHLENANTHNLPVGYAAMILRQDFRPRNRRAIESGREKLWGSSSSTAKHADLEYTHLHVMINKTLQLIYQSLNRSQETSNSAVELIDAILENLVRASSSRVIILRVIQDGIAAFLRDPCRRLSTKNTATSALVTRIQQLWDTALVQLGNLSRKDTALLQAFDVLLSAGFSSPRLAIVNATVTFWNDTFGREESIDYPPRVAKALRKLERVVDHLQLPNPLPSNEDIPDSPLSIESSDDETFKTERSLAVPTGIKKPVPSFRFSPSPMVSPAHSTRPIVGSPLRKTMTPRSKPRHEDSQILFEAIDSSPVPELGSQLLTEHQKEVAERQRQSSAAMFPDISNPASRRRLDISSDPLEEETPTDKPSTPVLGPQPDEDLPGSSPIVASVSRRQSMSRRQPPKELIFGPERMDETFNIPSSPPAAEENDQLQTPPLENEANLPSTITPARIYAKLLERSSAEDIVAEARRTFEDPLSYIAMTGAENDFPAASVEDQASLANEEPAEALLLAAIRTHSEAANPAIPVDIPSKGDIGVNSDSSQITPGGHGTSNKTSVIPGTNTVTTTATTTTHANDSQEAAEEAIPETQVSPSAGKPIIGAEVSRVQDSFPVSEEPQSQNESTEVESSRVGNSQPVDARDLKPPNTQNGSQSSIPENNIAHDEESQTIASHIALSESQNMGKRKRGRPAKANVPAKKSKANPEPDIVIADYVARYSEIPAPEGPDVHESIVVKLSKAQEEAWRNNWRKSRERDGHGSISSPSFNGEGVSGNKMDGNERQVLDATTNFKVPALVTRQSSRLSQMFQDSPVSKGQGSGQGPPVARKGSQRLRNASIARDSPAQVPSFSRRSSSRLSLSRGDAIPPPDTAIISRRNRRNKRALKSVGLQSPMADNKDDVQVTPARKRRKTDPSTPTTSQSSSQRAFVEVTPGRRQASGVPPIVRRARKALSLGQGEAEDESEDEEEENKAITSFQSQLQTPRTNQLVAEAQTPGSVTRRILTPRSILDRLKGILADAKQLVFGGQEQREIHNVLFEVTREVMRK